MQVWKHITEGAYDNNDRPPLQAAWTSLTDSYSSVIRLQQSDWSYTILVGMTCSLFQKQMGALFFEHLIVNSKACQRQIAVRTLETEHTFLASTV